MANAELRWESQITYNMHGQTQGRLGVQQERVLKYIFYKWQLAHIPFHANCPPQPSEFHAHGAPLLIHDEKPVETSINKINNRITFKCSKL